MSYSNRNYWNGAHFFELIISFVECLFFRVLVGSRSMEVKSNSFTCTEKVSTRGELRGVKIFLLDFFSRKKELGGGKIVPALGRKSRMHSGRCKHLVTELENWKKESNKEIKSKSNASPSVSFKRESCDAYIQTLPVGVGNADFF